MTRWENFDNGVVLLDAKTVTLKDGTVGSIVMDTEHICIYKVDVATLGKILDLGEVFLDRIERDEPNAFVHDKDCQEAVERFIKQKIR